MKIKSRFFILIFKGMAMGAADVVPGVSGGTIALITGIYEELLATISGLNFGLLKLLRTDGVKAVWKKANLSFLFAVLTGIVISILTLAKLISWLLLEHPILLWSFFFGLVLASIFLVGKTVPKWNFVNVFGLVVGAVVAYLITIAIPASGSDNHAYIFVCGMIAICAMILPGISGSFILVLLGTYATVLGSLTQTMSALKSGNWSVFFSNGLTVIVFIAGCIIGLLTFSKVLNWLFNKAKGLTIAVLTGFLIGSLNKIWPWKQVTEYFIKHPGEPNEQMIPLVEKNLSPSAFSQILGYENHFLSALIIAILGFILIFLVEWIANRNTKKNGL